VFQIVNPLLVPDWDAQLSSIHTQNRTIFHSASWAWVLNGAYGYEPVYFAAWAGQSLAGVVPFMEVNSRWSGRRGVSLPFTDSCESIGLGSPEFSRFLKQLDGHGRSRGWRYWEIRGGEGLIDKVQPSLQFYVHTLDLREGERAIFNKFDSSVRRAIRKAESSNVEVEITQSEVAMEKFYRLQCGTRQKHGLPPQPWSFFREIQRHLISKGLGFVAVASRGQIPLAASLYLFLDKHAIYKFGASDIRFQEFRGSNLVMWRAIQHCVQLGIKFLDFGRTSLSNEGLRRFKLGWGTTEVQKSYFKYDLRSNQFVKEKDRSSGWHNQVFTRMPVPLLRLVGRLLYPHLA
jgi:hypothetical protein